jgi:ABC-type transport system involved in cytochrome c biogenesis permease subunit
MRFVKGLRGRKAVYVSMIGFASVIFTFLGVNYLSDLHGYLSGRG